MELKLKPSKENHFPLRGFLIKNPSVKEWMLEIQSLGFALIDVEIYPIPSNKANEIWGSLVITNKNITKQEVGSNELCQAVFSNFYILEKSIILPLLSQNDAKLILSEAIHIFHPEFGLVALESFNIGTLLNAPKEKMQYVFSPEASVFIPTEIHTFQIIPVSEEEVLKKIEENILSQKKKPKDKPLTIFEKGRLSFYKRLFKKTDEKDIHSETEKSGLLKRFLQLKNNLVGESKDNRGIEKMQDDFEDLSDRNQKEIDKLLNLLKNNPEEALKYAIPLDSNSSSRGTNNGEFRMSKMRDRFSLFGGLLGESLFGEMGSSSYGGSIDLGDHYHTLEAQYRKTAEDLIRQGKYEKAAFVYMKLLKDYDAAANALEEGKLYHEAAIIYVKHAKNKAKAAVCYEKGKMIKEAIALYEELNDYEKVGDLYVTINKKELAYKFYHKKISFLIDKNNYINASDLYTNKLNDVKQSQQILLEGWKKNIEATKCLIKYFDTINKNKLKQQYQYIYTKKVAPSKRAAFLSVVLHEYKKKSKHAKYLKKIAYELIAVEAVYNKSIVNELRRFNINDKEIKNDIFRFKTQKKIIKDGLK